MSVDRVGGSTSFPLYVFDRQGVGPPTPREQQAEDAAAEAQRTAENRRQARLEEERKAEREKQQEKQLERLDVERALRERTLDLADRRLVARGSIVDIEV